MLRNCSPKKLYQSICVIHYTCYGRICLVPFSLFILSSCAQKLLQKYFAIWYHVTLQQYQPFSSLWKCNYINLEFLNYLDKLICCVIRIFGIVRFFRQLVNATPDSCEYLTECSFREIRIFGCSFYSAAYRHCLKL